MRNKGSVIPIVATKAVETFVTYSKSRSQSAAVAYKNAIAHQQSEYQRQLGQAEAGKIRRQSEKILGQNTAKFAASGIDIGSSSALLAMESFASEAEISALEARNRGLSR
jgi:type II secretory pathway pseudopilin PulG